MTAAFVIDVVHIITKLELGGAQENTLYTCRGLDRARFRVTLMHGPGGMLDKEARALPDTSVERVPSLVRALSPADDARCVVDLSRRIARIARASRGPTIVHTHSSKAGILGRIAARAARAARVVHTIHGFGFHDGQSAVKRAVFVNAERAAGRLTDAFIGVSRANLAEARALGIVDWRHRTALIRSGFDLREFAEAGPAGAALRRELGLGDEDEVLVTVANLKAQKDPLTLVAAFALLAARRPRAVLLYAGDGDLRPLVESELARLGLSERFRLLGWRRDIAALIAAADVVVLASIFEGLPKAAVEAVAARRTVVATRVDGTPEIIRDGRNGFLVEPRDPARMAEAMERALLLRPLDPDDVERVQAWDADAMVRAQEELYQRIL